MTPPRLIEPLNSAQSKVLRVLVNGGRIEAHREYPFPRRHELIDENGMRVGGRVPETTVALLVEFKLVRSAHDQKGDCATYRATELAKVAVKTHSAIPSLAKQLELIPA